MGKRMLRITSLFILMVFGFSVVAFGASLEELVKQEKAAQATQAQQVTGSEQATSGSSGVAGGGQVQPDTIVNQNQSSTQQSSESLPSNAILPKGNTSGSVDSTNGYLNALEGATDSTKAVTTAVQDLSPVANVVAYIVQGVGYLTVVFMSVQMILGVSATGLRALRVPLGLHMPLQNNAQQGGMDMGMGSGFGMGGMNGGYGRGSRYGGAGMGMGMGMGMGGVDMGGQQSQGGTVQSILSALVPTACERAIQAEAAGGGKWRVFFKEAAVELIAIPVGIVLISTGVLFKLGFTVGFALTNLIGSFA